MFTKEGKGERDNEVRECKKNKVKTRGNTWKGWKNGRDGIKERKGREGKGEGRKGERCLHCDYRKGR